MTVAFKPHHISVPATRVNLWEENLSLEELQEIIAMLMDQSYFAIYRDDNNPKQLYLQRK